MSLTKAKGNMYGWVSHTWSVLEGQCPHGCPYCYVQKMAQRFPTMRKRFTGPLRLDEKALNTPLGKGRTIFVEHLNDLWADAVPGSMINEVLGHCVGENTFVFQSKNPVRFMRLLNVVPQKYPLMRMFGTTVETNRIHNTLTLPPYVRCLAMRDLRDAGQATFITVEPIMEFDVEPLLNALLYARPAFVNIGADSKRSGLPEPSPEKVHALIDGLTKAGIEVRCKSNLKRLL